MRLSAQMKALYEGFSTLFDPAPRLENPYEDAAGNPIPTAQNLARHWQQVGRYLGSAMHDFEPEYTRAAAQVEQIQEADPAEPYAPK